MSHDRSHLVDVQRAVALMDRAAMRGASNFGNRCDDTGVVARRPAAGTRRASGLRGERKLTMAIPFSGRPTRSGSRRHVTGSSLPHAGTPVVDYLHFSVYPTFALNGGRSAAVRKESTPLAFSRVTKAVERPTSCAARTSNERITAAAWLIDPAPCFASTGDARRHR
jgi:hypothetical protein